jgi:hypothetical protein
MSKLKVGDNVKIDDGSYAVRVDCFQKSLNIGAGDREFSVLDFPNYIPVLKDSFGDGVHDIYIKDTESGRIYLHSSCSLTKVEPSPKELTVSEISEKLGYKVKVIDG